jgi:hypothetical protein
MEANNFFEKTAQNLSISGQALLDQRLKLNPDVFMELNTTYLESFYRDYKENVKTFKEYFIFYLSFTISKN